MAGGYFLECEEGKKKRGESSLAIANGKDESHTEGKGAPWVAANLCRGAGREKRRGGGGAPFPYYAEGREDHRIEAQQAVDFWSMTPRIKPLLNEKRPPPSISTRSI